MLGAIIGDIIGSVYEWNNIKTKDFPLFRKDCFLQMTMVNDLVLLQRRL